MRQLYTTMSRSWEKDHQWDFKVDKGESGLKALAYLYLDGKNGSYVSVGQNYRGHKGLLDPPPGEGTDYSWYSGDKDIPSTVSDGKKTFTVKKIAKWAFISAANVHKVTLPSTIVEIEEEAFRYCGGINIINLDHNLKKIGNLAFHYCTNLNEVKLPDSVTEIGTSAFSNCLSMTKAVIGAGISYMDKVFSSCRNLKDITCRAIIPPVITEETFSDENYQNGVLNVPHNSLQNYKTAPYWNKFRNIRALPYDFDIDNIYYIIKDKNTVGVVASDNKYGGSGSIPSTVTLVYRGFKDGKLIEYTDTYKVTTIEDMAFNDCPDLTEVVLGDNITNIGYKAFANCPNLTSVYYNTMPTANDNVFENSPKAQFVPNNLRKGGCFQQNGIFYKIESCDGTYEVSVTYDKFGSGMKYKGRVVIPETVTYAGKIFYVIYIDSLAFSKCDELTAVTLPQNMWKIRKRAFWESKKLKSMVFGSSVVRIEKDAFSSCESLSEIKFMDGTRIRRNPSGTVSQVRDNRTLHMCEFAFANCKNLKKIVCEKMTPPEIENQNAFDQSTYDNATLVLKACDKEAYLNNPIWRRFYHIETVE